MPCYYVENVVIGFVDAISDGSAFDIIGNLPGKSTVMRAEPDDFRKDDIPDHLLHRIPIDDIRGIRIDVIPQADKYE
jgi:hypothetical protein